MANDLKRVGLVFTQEGAVDFKKSLQEINLELNKNYNQFKLTQAQWDKSTDSTKKLRAEQDYLKNAYEIQEDKVKTLRMQLSDLENAENKNTTAIKKKRNELTAAEVKLQEYNKRIKEIDNQLKNTGKQIEEFGNKVEEQGKKIEGAGKKMSALSGLAAAGLAASAKSAIDFEDAFAGVEKTVDGTVEQMAELKQGIRDMAKEIPSSTTEISAVAEAAGQLGIKTEDVLSFTRTMIDLGNATNLSAEEAATSLAKFANVTNLSAKDYSKLGSVVVALGNNFATTEADIVEMAKNLASTGSQVGMTQSDIMALATALSSVGLEAQAGGTAFSKALTKMQLAVETNSDELKDWADVAGMSVGEFADLFRRDATSALQKFIKGLSDTKGSTKSAIKVLDDMGITETRMRDALLRSANASDIFTKAINMGSKAWEDNTALTKEANKRYETLKSKIEIAMNKIKDIAITVGNKLMPAIEKVIDGIEKWAEGFSKLNDEQVQAIVNIGLAVAAISPLLTIVGKITSTAGGAIKTIGTVTQAIGVARGTITSTSAAVNGLAKVFTVMSGPIGIACVAIGAAVAGIAIAVENAAKETKRDFETMGKSASDFVKGIETAESYLSGFNSTLFATNEEQQELRANMDEIQQGITDICKRAADERRGYTQEEITQLDEYFTKLRELKNREIEIQNSIAEAITQQAKTTAETFQGTLAEYEVQSQRWIKTATEQKDATVRLIEEGTIEEVALLNQRFSTEEEKQSEAYQNEYSAIMEQKQKKIDAANEEVAEVIRIYAEHYLERNKENNGFYNTFKEFMEKQESLQEGHNKKLEQIKNNELWYVTNNAQAINSENETFAFHQKEIWDEMYKNMSDEQADQLGVWLAMLADSEVYGNKISEEDQKMVNGILKSYESMPSKTRDAMKNAMSPMLEEMENKEPSLFARASGIANGILSRLRQAFDIHSPSKKTREIFKNVMKRNGKRYCR